MPFEIREIESNEYNLLEKFIYEAIYVPAGKVKPPKDIIFMPELQVYIENFGDKEDDYGLVAICEGEIVGAVWVRIMNDYGHIDDETPSLALAILEPYRGQGMGTALMKSMLIALKQKGYQYVSLSVQKPNPAHRLYDRLGFEAIGDMAGETEDEIIMKCRLR